MFKKLNFKSLIIILLVLVGIVIIINLTGKKERTFKTKVLEFDPELITGMKVFNPQMDDIITLVKQEEDTWEVSSEGKTYKADGNAIVHMLEMLSDLKTMHIAATSEDKWEDFHVSDKSGIRIELLQEKDIVADLMIGKFSYKLKEPQGLEQPMQQQQKKATMTSYLRVVDEDEVYAVDGILRMNFTSGIEFFRNKEIIGKDPKQLTKLTFTYPDQSFTLEQSGGYWFLEGQPVDSLKTARFLRTIATFRSSDFMDDVNLEGATSVMDLMVEGIDFDPIDINVYPASDTNILYYVTSTHNPETVLNGTKGKLVDRTFVGKEQFLPKL